MQTKLPTLSFQVFPDFNEFQDGDELTASIVASIGYDAGDLGTNKGIYDSVCVCTSRLVDGPHGVTQSFESGILPVLETFLATLKVMCKAEPAMRNRNEMRV